VYSYKDVVDAAGKHGRVDWCPAFTPSLNVVHPRIICPLASIMTQDIRLTSKSAEYVVHVSDDGSVHLRNNDDTRCLPLVEVRINGEGNHTGQQKASKGLIGGGTSTRLRYHSHSLSSDDSLSILKTVLKDETTGITVTSHLILLNDVLRSRSSIQNDSSTAITINNISSFVASNLTSSPQEWWNTHKLLTCNHTWFREAQWQEHSLPSLGLDDFGLYRPHRIDAKESMAYYSLSNRSTFTTQGHLPMGLLVDEEGEEVWAWQIENNGAWRWDVGDYNGQLYIATSGPEAVDHDWRLKLKSGESYHTPITAVYHGKGSGKGSVTEAFAALTTYRRKIIRPHADYASMPIIFNDYMNCLLGDPTDEKILALLEPVAKSGAEYFVIDAGWYADDGEWWDDVGEWEPSKRRFPMGFKELLRKIEEAGLKPGLWVEPEVIGVRSKIASELPHEAFMQRDGHRITERGRYHLDFRHPAVIKRLNSVIDRLVNEYGAKYFKFDYNIEHSLGTDIDTSSPGVAQAEHGQAYLRWVRSLLDRYPWLVLENCSSGGMRMEYDMLSTYTLQSTSDQQDPELYAAIAASLPTAVLPEQSASWAYPQPEWSDEINALTVANSLLGRIHLSGRLDLLSEHQLENIVYEGMRVYKSIRMDLLDSTAFWPLGLPKWNVKWLALGMKVNEKKSYLMVWKRGGVGVQKLPLGEKGQEARVSLIYPKSFQVEASWKAHTGCLEVGMEAEICARLFQIDF
jgi:alpha-galactosidase